METSSFRVTLPSVSRKKIYPDNAANSYRVRLADPIRLDSGDWKVGLQSISLPDAKINVLKLGYLTDDFFLKSDPNLTLFRENYVLYPPLGTKLTTGFVTHTFTEKESIGEGHNAIKTQRLSIQEMKDASSISNGVEFMTHALDWLQQKRLRFNVKQGTSLFDSHGHSMYPSFSWEVRNGKHELLLDSQPQNSNKDHQYVRMYFHWQFGEKMGWWKKNKDNTFTLGHNVLIDDWIDPRTTDDDTFITTEKFGTDDEDATKEENERKNPFYVLLKSGYRWRFVNIDEAFKGIVGSPARTLFVYTDVNASSRTGDQVTELLREVQYKRGGEGSAYFEPMKIQYLPLRSTFIETIEVQVAETNGKLVVFGEGITILTLHFKKE